jgi:hypothetical protein
MSSPALDKKQQKWQWTLRAPDTWSAGAPLHGLHASLCNHLKTKLLVEGLKGEHADCGTPTPLTEHKHLVGKGLLHNTGAEP